MKRHPWLAPLLLIGLGVLLLDLFRTYWPVLLIAGGLSQLLLLNGWRASRSNPR
jgi:hypothetical protein